MKELGIQMIPAYSPQARGRSERSFGTWQGRWPQELRLANIPQVEDANTFLRERYMAEFNQKFTVPAREPGTAFRKTGRSDLDWIFSLQTERVVARTTPLRFVTRPGSWRKRIGATAWPIAPSPYTSIWTDEFQCATALT
jgi:hypothetical protein